MKLATKSWLVSRGWNIPELVEQKKVRKFFLFFLKNRFILFLYFYQIKSNVDTFSVYYFCFYSLLYHQFSSLSVFLFLLSSYLPISSMYISFISSTTVLLLPFFYLHSFILSFFYSFILLFFHSFFLSFFFLSFS